MLDIIVTHYNEPWKTGKKFFDMLACQQCVDFSKINVILIHDGSEYFHQSLFEDYPYRVCQYAIEHGGVSAARNAGIEFSSRKWLQFCDFDDMYSNAFSLKAILDLLDTDDYDMLWADFWAIDKSVDGQWRIIQRKENVVFIHGKLFRRDYLMQSGLRFDTELEFNEDSLFCTTAFETIPAERIGHINTNTPVYVWCYTESSATASPDNWWRAYVGTYQRNIRVLRLFKGKPDRYHMMIARTVFDAYYALNIDNMPEGLVNCLEHFRAFYRKNKDAFWATDPEEMRIVLEASKKQYVTGEEEALRRWGYVPMHRREGVNIKQWLDGLESGVF